MNVILDEKQKKRLERKLLEKPVMNNADPHSAKSIYCFLVRGLDGQPVSLDKYRKQVCIFVNIAITDIGFTHYNFTLLRNLYRKFGEQGLNILMFPCNQFNKSEKQLRTKDYVKFVENFGHMTVDLYGKVQVNCDHGSPVWKFLKNTVDIGEKRLIKDPYEKFLVDKKGEPVARFGPHAKEWEVEDAVANCFR